jgi:hemerythrin-like domain-containing protein
VTIQVLKLKQDIGVVEIGRSIMKKLKDILNEIKVNEAIPKFSSLAKAFDYIQRLRGQSMDLEQTMRTTLADIQDLQRDMEQEAEPEGGPIANKYAREMEYLKRQYNKTKAEFEKVMDEIDEFDQKYL